MKGGVINIHVLHNPAFSQQLSRFDMPRSWVQSLLLEGLEQPSCALDQSILGMCKNEIVLYTTEMVFQTPSSYVSVGRLIMAAHGSKSVPIAGLKRNITLTFVVSLAGEFLPGKTKQRGFVFPKDWSNEHRRRSN